MPSPATAPAATSERGGRGTPGSSGPRLAPLRAIAAGICIAASMPPWGWWPLVFVGLVLLDGVIAGQPAARRFRRGWLAGAAWIWPSTVWMIDMTAPGYVAAGLILSAYLGAACAVMPAGRWRWLAWPGALALAEFARASFPFGGIPLSTIPMSQVGSPLVGISRVGGGLTLTFAVTAAAVGVAALVGRSWRQAAVAGAAVAGLVGLAAIAPRGHGVGQLRLAIVQGGGPQNTRAVDTDEREVFERHLQASAAVATPVDIVLWPEDVVKTSGEFVDSPEQGELSALARRLGATVIPGVVESYLDHFKNLSAVINPAGAVIDRYDKVQRVPFGEFVPFRSVVDPLSGGAVSKYIPREARAGTGPAVLDTPHGPVGVVISWEVFFERRARDAIGNGGEVLLNPTNGSSYWLTIVQSQQVASSRLRAVETDRWVAQAAPTGFSALITPSGRVVERSSISEARVIAGTVEARQGLTWAVAWGPWPWLVVSLALVAAANVAAARGRRHTSNNSVAGP